MTDYDTELMLRVRDGETAAFRELFERHYSRAVNIAYRSLGNLELAEDVAMEAFARIFESRSRFRGDAKFSTYFYRVLVNLCINTSRRRGVGDTRSLDSADLIAPATDDPAAVARRSELTRAVKDAILSLPQQQRMAIVLTRYEQLSYQDAAEAMGVSVKAVESLLHRAKQNLRKRLKDFV